jgi:hypothetical protein
LLGGDKQERGTFGGSFKRGADFRKATEGLAAASGAEKETRLHESPVSSFPFSVSSCKRAGVPRDRKVTFLKIPLAQCSIEGEIKN